MSLVSQEIKNLVGGISQQPDQLRYPEQGERQINAFSSETDGLQKRPPSKFIKRLGESGSFGAKPLIHLINRDAKEQYYVIFDGQSIKVFDLKGNEHVVNGDFNYATTQSPREYLRMVTIADYTFVVNRSVVVKPGTELTPTYKDQNRALIVVRGGQYGRSLSVGINGTWTAAVVLPNGSTASDVQQMDASSIADKLGAAIKKVWPTYTININGAGYIEIITPDDTPITEISTKDGYNNDLIYPVWTKVSQAAKLPLVAPDGYVVKISGISNQTSDDYYVRYDANNRIWKECPQLGVRKGINASTMPHVLISNADGTFDFKEFTWGERSSGDYDSNPDPSFVENTINDCFFFSNRLGFLSGENVILSAAAKYGNFYMPSVSVTGDADPIDVASSDNRINILKFAVPFSEQLLLWSNDSQFILSKNGALTGKTINIDLTTNFNVSDYARPYSLGRGVYFCSPRSTFSSINRFYAVQDDSSVNNASDISAHVPNYIPNGIFSIKGSNTENFITLLTEGARNIIYMYKFLYIDEQVRQQSWSHWEFPEETHILACDCIDSKMYVLYDSINGMCLESIDFTQNTKDYDSELYRYYIDGKVEYTIPDDNYDFFTNKTMVDMSEVYGNFGSRYDYVLILDDGFMYRFPYDEDEPWSLTNDKIWVNGNYAGKTVTIGRSYSFVYEFSKLLIKNTADDGSTATESSGRLQLRRVYLNYKNTGAFNIIVNNGATTFITDQAGAAIGTNDLRLNTINIQSAQVRFAATGNAKNLSVALYSDHPTPISIVGAGWEGMYFRRTNGI
ncbi:TPA: hypothetical protein PFE07_004545 [Kluyvera cryocrescens]|nr:hypothetical protein [Kluyvera cryocrescens]